MKKITITQLMNRYKFSDLTNELAAVWEHNPVGTDYRDFKTLYKRLQKMTAVSTDFKIYVNDRWDTDWREERCEVIGADDPLPFRIEWNDSLAEVLGMEAVVSNDVEISEKELLAGLFHEITLTDTTEKTELVKPHYWIPWFNNPRNQWRMRRLKGWLTRPFLLLYNKFFYEEEVECTKRSRKRGRT